MSAGSGQRGQSAGPLAPHPRGATVVQQYLVDELPLHLAPLLLGAGKRRFENLGDQVIELERTRVIESPYTTHLDFSVRR